jgi:hypothetical protein
MKKVLLALVLAVFLFIPVKRVLVADELTYERAYSDYTYNLAQYQKAYADYQLTRTQYLTSQTLGNQTAAQEATLRMLQTRDEVVKTHLTALRMKISDTEGISGSEKELYFSQIDQEVKWYDTHKTNLPSTGSLDDLVDDSAKAEDRYKSTILIMYNGLAAVSLGKVVNYQNNLATTISELKTKISEIRMNGDKDTTKTERWVLEVDNRLTRSKDKITEARTLLFKMKSDSRDQLSIFNSAQFKAGEGLQFLKEVDNYLVEIIKELKTAD